MVKNVKNGVGSEPIRIRAHHLLCMQGFQGFGYNKKFTENMAQIIEKTIKNSSSFIQVMIGTDSICQMCPHNSQGICNRDSSNNIKIMDSAVIEKLKIEQGSVHSSASLLSKTMKLNSQTVKKLCGNCSWRNKCLYFQEKML
ncbi:DUF1284 domain-containing protein [Methanobacterium petrolearium]|uniref:DUF1284 domain-containing protein n=1 Tax=Methanobacterium petrolearium TaxID=710190 RepID=UPI001AE1451E|nr:DUF1284 domain-containing protein [Methanobacterium petrolearium]MBP1946335.1 hypothetical protein [Methanobacterium petrolearium]